MGVCVETQIETRFDGVGTRFGHVKTQIKVLRPSLLVLVPWIMFRIVFDCQK